MPSKNFVYILVVGLLLTGTINTLLNKFQDIQCVKDCDGPNPRTFEQPVWQTANMFLGESLCLLVSYFQSWNESRKRRSFQPILDADLRNNLETNLHDEVDDDTAETPLTPLASQRMHMSGWVNLYMWIPTLCDLCATTLMNVGLIYVAASVYQMLRGSVVLFTGTLSTVYLGRKNALYKWFALGAIFAGVALVGAASVLQSDSPGKSSAIDPSSVISAYTANHPNAPLGVFMVIVAQIFTASQFVIEEKLLSYYELPAMKAVGLEGIFGLLSLAILVPIIYFTYGIHHPGGFFDVPGGWVQMVSHPTVLGAGFSICFSIASFNWFGLSVTRSISSTSRSTIDTCRTLFIWFVSLMLGWENFKSLQVVGFLVLLYGTFLYNDLIKPPFAFCHMSHGNERVSIGAADYERAVASAT